MNIAVEHLPSPATLLRYFFSVCLLSPAISSFALPEANDSSDEKMDVIIVTASQSRSIIDIPRNVTTINSIDIENSGASNLPELLSSQANIVLTSFSGNSKFSRVDIRGSGDTSVSNVLVLVDGIRLNMPDLNGAEFSVVPLDQIERIEIVRGANSVRYGSGASQGVINILTKSGSDTSKLSLKHTARSFSGSDIDFHTSFGDSYERFSVNYSREFSDGYRDFSKYSARTLLASYQYLLNQDMWLKLIGRNHYHSFQLPGFLSAERLETGEENPTDSVNLQTEGENHDQNIALINQWEVTKSVQLSTQAFYRERENRSASPPGRTPGLIRLYNSGFEFNSDIDIESLSLLWTQGFQYSHPSYLRTRGPENQRNLGAIEGNLENFSYFSALDINYFDALVIGLGGRINRTNNRFSKTGVEAEQRSSAWKNEAFELSLVWNLGRDTRIFTSAAKTFRLPNIDELACSPGNLKPQTGYRYELGFKHDSNFIDSGISLFSYNTMDEILYREGEQCGSSFSGANINAPHPIQRNGLEFSLGTTFDWGLSLRYQFGYVDAKDDLGDRIPHVARYNHSLQTSLNYGAWTLSANARHTASRLDGNHNESLAQEGYEISSYTLSGVRIAFEKPVSIGKLHFFAGINNLANERYITASYSRTVYPGNGREYYGGIKHEI